MEWLILTSALFLAGILAVVKAFQYVPSPLSEFELSRRANAGDGVAAYELQRRPLLPALVGLKVLKIVAITSALAALLLLNHDLVLGGALLITFGLAAELVVAKGWSLSAAIAVQRAVEPRIIHFVHHVGVIFKHLAPKHAQAQPRSVASRDELLHIIDQDTILLSASEKTRMQSALTFGELTIADGMVPREAIATVGVKETVGPVLLDRLHKAGHAIFVVINKDLDDIKGLLYMSDATSGHPDIKTVKDAMRPAVRYLLSDQPLEAVLSASLQSGRQLFIVVDNHGNTVGLISLRDAITKLLGTAPSEQIRLSTDPTKV